MRVRVRGLVLVEFQREWVGEERMKEKERKEERKREAGEERVRVIESEGIRECE